ncbi:MAG: hypothetical protein FWF81_10470 [Defluviitaleaceae bacterium]|nr:hypothetical protein [Defluviitaleaceae bacterium]
MNIKRKFKQFIALTLSAVFGLSGIVFAEPSHEYVYFDEPTTATTHESESLCRNDGESILYETHETVTYDEIFSDEIFSNEATHYFTSFLGSKLYEIVQLSGRRSARIAIYLSQYSESKALFVLPHDSMGVPIYDAKMELTVNGILSVHHTQDGVFFVENVPVGSDVNFHIISDFGNFIPRRINNFNHEMHGIQLRTAIDEIEYTSRFCAITDADLRLEGFAASGLPRIATPMTAIGDENFNLALRHDGTVWGWGENSGGQLGLGDSVDRHTPTQISNLSNITYISAGGAIGVALRNDGTVWSWGSGSLGNGASTTRRIPERVTTLPRITAVSAGSQHTAALCADGWVYTWGVNFFGALGDGTTTTRHFPVQVGISGVAAISAGTSHTLALLNSGTVWAWGTNWTGQLGNGSTTRSTEPVRVQGLTDVIDIAAGYTVSVALRNDGTVWTWGNGRLIPVQIPGLTNITAIDAGGGQIVAVRGDGTVWNISSGGSGNAEQLQDLSNIVAISRGYGSIIAIRSDGRVQINRTLVPDSGGSGYFYIGATEFPDLPNYPTRLIYDMQTDPHWLSISPQPIHPILRASASGGALLSNEAVRVIRFPSRNGTSQGIRVRAAALLDALGENEGAVKIVYGGSLRNMTFQQSSSQIRIEQNPAPEWAQGTNVWQRSANANGTFAQATILTRERLHHAATVGTGEISLGATPGNAQLIFTDIRIYAIASPQLPKNEIYNMQTDTNWSAIFSPTAHPIMRGANTSGTTTPVGETVRELHFPNRSGTSHGLRINAAALLAALTNESSKIEIVYSGQLNVTGSSQIRFERSTTNVWQQPTTSAGNTFTHTLTLTHRQLQQAIAETGNSDITLGAFPANAQLTITDIRINEILAPSVELDITPMRIAGGSGHSVAVCSRGLVWTWGANGSGQLGIGSNQDSRTPVLVHNLYDVAAVAAGSLYTLALRNDGTVWSWGNNGSGALGNGTTISSTTPIQVYNLSNVISIAAGSTHNLALRNDGTVWAWGNGHFGRLGDGTSTSHRTPIQVTNLDSIIAIAAADTHSVALRSDGTVWIWGRNNVGQLGNETTGDSFVPIQVQNLGHVVAIAAGAPGIDGDHTMALLRDGTVRTWGRNTSRQLGDGSQVQNRLSPVSVLNLNNIVSVSSGRQHSFAILANGTVRAWGSNLFGNLGINSANLHSLPVQPHILTNVTAITGGSSHSLALTADGTFWAWGDNTSGQVGDSTLTQRNAPVRVAAFNAPDEFGITVNSTTGGTAFANRENAMAGQIVNITANSALNNRFLYWEVVSGFADIAAPTSPHQSFVMQNSDVEIRAVFTPSAWPLTHTVAVSSVGSGSVERSHTSAAQGTQVTLTATPNTNHEFVRWEVITGSITIPVASARNLTFTMPNEAVQVRAVFGIPGGSITNVTFQQAQSTIHAGRHSFAQFSVTTSGIPVSSASYYVTLNNAPVGMSPSNEPNESIGIFSSGSVSIWVNGATNGNIFSSGGYTISITLWCRVSGNHIATSEDFLVDVPSRPANTGVSIRSARANSPETAQLILRTRATLAERNAGNTRNAVNIEHDQYSLYESWYRVHLPAGENFINVNPGGAGTERFVDVTIFSANDMGIAFSEQIRRPNANPANFTVSRLFMVSSAGYYFIRIVGDSPPNIGQHIIWSVGYSTDLS